MKTLWAIEIQPFCSPRAQPWINYATVRALRKDAWAAYVEGASPMWLKTIQHQRRKGNIRCIKVTLTASDTSGVRRPLRFVNRGATI